MPDFTLFFHSILSEIAAFLMVEPINYFTGLCVLLFVAALADRIMHGRR